MAFQILPFPTVKIQDSNSLDIYRCTILEPWAQLIQPFINLYVKGASKIHLFSHRVILTGPCSYLCGKVGLPGPSHHLPGNTPGSFEALMLSYKKQQRLYKSIQDHILHRLKNICIWLVSYMNTDIYCKKQYQIALEFKYKIVSMIFYIVSYLVWKKYIIIWWYIRSCLNTSCNNGWWRFKKKVSL